MVGPNRQFWLCLRLLTIKANASIGTCLEKIIGLDHVDVWQIDNRIRIKPKLAAPVRHPSRPGADLTNVASAPVARDARQQPGCKDRVRIALPEQPPTCLKLEQASRDVWRLDVYAQSLRDTREDFVGVSMQVHSVEALLRVFHGQGSDGFGQRYELVLC